MPLGKLGNLSTEASLSERRRSSNTVLVLLVIMLTALASHVLAGRSALYFAGSRLFAISYKLMEFPLGAVLSK